MSQTPEDLSDTTGPTASADALAAVLGALRVTGSLLLFEEYPVPWAIALPDGGSLARTMDLAPGIDVVAFHLVRSGTCELWRKGHPRQTVRAGEVVIMTGRGAHTLREGSPRTTMSLAEVLAAKAQPTASKRTTALLCGMFMLRDLGSSPLARALPEVLHVPLATPTANASARGLTQLLLAEFGQPRPGRPWVVARLLELLFAEAVLATDVRADVRPNWLRAVHDRDIGRALDAFHRAPAEPWTVARLARHAALSPSRFAARFRELLGEAPMTYASNWRLGLAATRLAQADAPISVIASDAGYDTLAAFSRAFKRRHGVSPSQVRRAGASTPI